MTTDIPKKLDIGCGSSKPDGFYGIDVKDTSVVDVVHDLHGVPWPLPANHFTEIRIIDVFEHIQNPIEFMEELYRISHPNASILIQGPHFSSGNWHDPTHKRLLGSRTFEHFTEETRFTFYSDCSFEVTDVRITFEWTSFKPAKFLGRLLANNYMQTYERSFLRNLFPATNIRFQLTVIKDKGG